MAPPLLCDFVEQVKEMNWKPDEEEAGQDDIVICIIRLVLLWFYFLA